MNYIDEERAPKLFMPRHFVAAIGLHVALFAVFYYLALPLPVKETVIPIELTFEAPPQEVAPAPQPKPRRAVQPKPKVEEPPKVEDPKVDAVVKVKDKPKPRKVEKKPEPPKEKKVEEKKPEPPKKTTESRAERLARMRDGAKVVKNPKPTPVAGTGKKLDERWRELVNNGYKPGASTQLAESEEQRCISLIREAFYAKWDRPPWSSSLREMVLRVTFSADGHVVGCKLVESSGDARADRSVTLTGSLVKQIYGLTPEFLNKYNRTVDVRFKVTPQ